MKTTASPTEKEIQKLKKELEKLKKTSSSRIKKLEKENAQFLQQIKGRCCEEISTQNFMDIAGVMFISLNANGLITMVNRKAAQILGYTENEVIGMNWFNNFLLKENLDEVKAVFDKLMKGEVDPVEFYENPIVSKSGETRIIAWHNSVIRNSNNEIIGLLSSGEDRTQKILAEIELKESQNRLKTLSEASFEAIFVSEKGICIDQNNIAEDMFGYTREEAIGVMGTEWIIPSDRDIVLKNMTNNETEPYEVTALRKDGTTFPCEIQARVTSINGKKLRFTALRDISDRKEAEKRINQSEQKYRTLFENIQEAVALHEMVFDKEGNPVDFIWLDVNPNYEEITLLKKEDIVGKRGLDVIPSIEQRWMDAYGEVVKTGKSTTIIDHSEYLDKYWEVKAFRPSPGLFATAMVDITTRKKAEIERDRIFNASVDMICTASFDGFLKQLNPAWEKTLGWSNEELRSKPFIEFLHPDDVGPTTEAASGISSGESMIGFQNRYKTKNGDYKWLSWNTIPFVEDGFMLGIARDISLTKETESELIDAKVKAEEADQLKTAFLANMSHEIRTPMNGILGFTELLREPNLNGEKRDKYIEIIRKSGNRMLSTVNDIIEISKIETGQITPNVGEVNVNDMLVDYFNFFKPETDKKSLDLSFKSNLKTESPIVISDKAMIDSIMTNLIKNSIKYTDSGNIEFGVTYKKECLEFYVKDTGTGINKDRQAAIFDRFTQADIEDKQAKEGSGLGLSIVKAYINMLNGKIDLESEPGKGSVFRVCLPVEYTDFELIASSGKLFDDKHDNKLKVLIVEDDVISEMHMSILLKELSDQIIVARTGLEAVEICEKHDDFDLILMDIKIPELNGYEAARRIRKFNSKVKIIAQTAYALPGDKETAKKAGCDDYITKPIIKENLLTMIKKVM